MPYICLANANVRDGVVQITDLWPNESQRVPGNTPAGQNRYLRRPAQDQVGLSSTGEIVGLRSDANKQHLEGLGAYLLDCVEPGGTETATGTVTAAGVLVGDTLTATAPGGDVTLTAVEHNPVGTITVVSPTAGMAQLTLGGVAFACWQNAARGNITPAAVQPGHTVTIAGIPFVGANGATPADGIFDRSGTDQQTSNSLVAVINTAAPRAAITAALNALVEVPVAGAYIEASNSGGTTTVITLTAINAPGAWGDAALVNTVGATLPVSGPTMTHTDADISLQRFNSLAHYSGRANPVAAVTASLTATINHAATIALMNAANAGPVPTAKSGHMVAVDGALLAVPTPTVNLTASQPGYSGTLTLATAQVVNLAISGATLSRVPAVAASQEFDSLINSNGGTNTAVAVTLAAALNHANTDAVLLAVGGSSVTAVPALAVTSITADTAGAAGSMKLTGTSAARVVVSAGGLAKTMAAWTGTLLADSVAAVQDLVDTGAACTVTAIDNALNGLAGVSGISVATTGSSSLADILSVLAGRVYRVPVGTVKDATGQTWDVTRAGGFTTPNVVYDTAMDFGEWRSTTGWLKHGKERQAVVSGGDTVNNEIGGVRTTVDSAHFQQSLQNGQLAAYTAGVNLFPDPEVQAFVSNWTRRTYRQAPLVNQRVVTVYDDDGTLLA